MREKAAEGRGLYRPEFEHDACGIGAVVDIQGRASHETCLLYTSDAADEG